MKSDICVSYLLSANMDTLLICGFSVLAVALLGMVMLIAKQKMNKMCSYLYKLTKSSVFSKPPENDEDQEGDVPEAIETETEREVVENFYSLATEATAPDSEEEHFKQQPEENPYYSEITKNIRKKLPLPSIDENETYYNIHTKPKRPPRNDAPPLPPRNVPTDRTCSENDHDDNEDVEDSNVPMSRQEIEDLVREELAIENNLIRNYPQMPSNFNWTLSETDCETETVLDPKEHDEALGAVEENSYIEEDAPLLPPRNVLPYYIPTATTFNDVQQMSHQQLEDCVMEQITVYNNIIRYNPQMPSNFNWTFSTIHPPLPSSYNVLNPTEDDGTSGAVDTLRTNSTSTTIYPHFQSSFYMPVANTSENAENDVSNIGTHRSSMTEYPQIPPEFYWSGFETKENDNSVSITMEKEEETKQQRNSSTKKSATKMYPKTPNLTTLVQLLDFGEYQRELEIIASDGNQSSPSNIKKSEIRILDINSYSHAESSNENNLDDEVDIQTEKGDHESPPKVHNDLEEVLERTKPYYCQICDKGNNDFNGFSQHLFKSHGECFCHSEKFQKSENSIEQSIYPVDSGSLTFINQKLIPENSTSHQETEEDENKRYDCKIETNNKICKSQKGKNKSIKEIQQHLKSWHKMCFCKVDIETFLNV